MIRRREDWPERLAEALEAMRARPFAWGAHDCALAACSVVEAITGVDPAADLRGTYADEDGAAEALGDGGLVGACERIADRLGVPEVPVPLARRGDLVLIVLPDHGQALGVVGDDGRAWFAGSAGASRLRLVRCSRAWRIG